MANTKPRMTPSAPQETPESTAERKPDRGRGWSLGCNILLGWL